MTEGFRRKRKRTIESKRLLFIRGQLAVGNLKPKRETSREDALKRFMDRLTIDAPIVANSRR